MVVMKTYKYKLYQNKKNKNLDRQVEIAAEKKGILRKRSVKTYVN